MSNPKVRHADAKLFLPKKGNSVISKTFNFCIEDFLEKLNVDAEKVEDLVNFLEAPGILIGYHRVSHSIFKEAGSIHLGVSVSSSAKLNEKMISKLMKVKVEGICGNAPVKEELDHDEDADDDTLYVKLEEMKHLKEAMITSESHKLDLHVDLLIEETKWIIERKKPRLDYDDDDVVDNIFKDEDFKDFTLESEEGTKIPCHRLLLGAQSTVLKRMFIAPMAEKNNSTLKMEYKADIVEKFVKFFYSEKIEEEKEENLRCYLELAEKYNIPRLKELVEELAITKLNVENMVDFFLLADHFSAENLGKAARDFIKSNKKKVRESLAELEKLEKSQMMKIMDIFVE